MYKGFHLILDIVQEIDDSPFTKEEIPGDYHRELANSFLSEFLKDENAVKKLFVEKSYDYLTDRLTFDKQAYTFFENHIENIDEDLDKFGDHREEQIIAEVADRCRPDVRSFIYKVFSVKNLKGMPLQEISLNPTEEEDCFDVLVKRLLNFKIYIAGLKKEKEE